MTDEEAAVGENWTVVGLTYDDPTSIDYEEHEELRVKVFRYIVSYNGSRKIPPLDLDYTTGLSRRLYKKEYFTHGELDRVEYYAETDTGSDGWPTYSDLIIREDMSYTRDSLGFAKERTTEITWILENESEHETKKTLHKPYSLIESQKEGVTRRGNIIGQLSLQVAGMLIGTLPTNDTYPNAQAKIDVGRQFMQDHKLATDMFIAASKRDIVGQVKHATDSWLENYVDAHGTKIRDVIRASVDIWGIWDSV